MNYKILTDGKTEVPIIFGKVDGNILNIQEGAFKVKSQGKMILFHRSLISQKGEIEGKVLDLQCFTGAEQSEEDEKSIKKLIMENF